jgi:hypothetical protein
MAGFIADEGTAFDIALQGTAPPFNTIGIATQGFYVDPRGFIGPLDTHTFELCLEMARSFDAAIKRTVATEFEIEA